MAFQVRTEKRARAEKLDPTLWILEGGGGRAEIWPAQGFNCFHWSVGNLDVLYADPQFLEGSSPTRTGIPILFPFPNRIRDGRFVWEGKEYRLPINDPAKKNAIHGFVCRKPWPVVDQGADAGSAWVTGEFLGSRDAPECRPLWPADYRIRVTYRLLPNRLRIEAVVDNPEQVALPFGLGYHHYFQIAPASSEPCLVQVSARNYWDLQECLPSGARSRVDSARDLNSWRSYQELALDDVLTDLSGQPGTDGLCYRGGVRRGPGIEVRMATSPAFREAVVFTPPHRQAFCIEPYTCATDAINLQQLGVDAGLSVLGPAQKWAGVVEMMVS